jgi:CubicO group peptidase (beta-lactamase class C family)
MKLNKGKPEEVGVSPDRVSALVKRAQGWVDAKIHPSLVMIAARRGTIFLDEAIGYLSPDNNSPPLNRDSLFPLASISKLITATAAMILVEDGLLSLNRPVADYIPEFANGENNRVLVRHLMTHTSGIREEDVNSRIKEVGVKWEDPFPFYWLVDNYERYLSLIYETPISLAPDSMMTYADTNFDILGEIIQRVSGMSLANYFQDKIFQPLGMKSSCLTVPEKMRQFVVIRPPTAPAYDFTLHAQDIPLGSMGVFSSAMDMAIFGQMFLNGGVYGNTRVLSRPSTEAMTSNQIPGVEGRFRDEIIPEAEWGLGWSVHVNGKSWASDEILLSQNAFCHGGAGGVFLWVDPVYEIVAVFFSVYLEILENERPNAYTDLFINAVLSSIVDL